MDLSSNEFTNFTIEEMDLDLKTDLNLIKNFTDANGFNFDKRDVKHTIGLFNENEELIGTGSYSGNTLKYVLVDKNYRESKAFAQITTHLITKVLEKHRHIFVYTKPELITLFEGLGFRLVEKAPPLFCMLEFGVESVRDYVSYLEVIRSKNNYDKVAAIVVNCNPFTKGHLYLIEKAAAESDLLYLIVVEEDLSVFPFNIRWELIKEGISHLDNIIMVKGGHYVVSGATFPSYFLKSAKTDAIIENQAELDIRIFCKYVVKTLGINCRFVGTERDCQTTAAYNRAMHKILPQYGVDVFEIERKKMESCGSCISASRIRDAIREDRLESVLDRLPESTQRFLLSEEALPIIEKVKTSTKRH